MDLKFLLGPARLEMSVAISGQIALLNLGHKRRSNAVPR